VACSSSPSTPPEDAGGTDGGVVDASAPRDATPDASTPDASTTPDAGPPATPVAHERELRSVWLTSVYNLDWPSRSGLSADAQRAELDALFDLLAGAGFNAVFL